MADLFGYEEPNPDPIPIVHSSQGQSAATIDKERRIGSALSIGMRALRRFGGYTYWHCDVNSGCGFNEQAGVDGSPLVFWQLADRFLGHMHPVAIFCDWNQTLVVELEKRLCARPDWRRSSLLFERDNEEVLEVFAELIRSKERPRFAVGSVIVDPNGYFYKNKKGEGAPVQSLLRFVEEFPRIDVILNLNMRTYKLQKAPPNSHDVMPPMKVLDALGKQHWLVGKAQAGGSQWFLAVGRNFKTGDHRNIGMHALNSPAGQCIMNLIEGGRQSELGDAT